MRLSVLRDVYEMKCLTGHKHLVIITEERGTIFVECDARTCQARAACYHMAAAAERYALDHLPRGTKILVNETTGPRWHHFIETRNDLVFTREVTEGFSHVFVIGADYPVRRAA